MSEKLRELDNKQLEVDLRLCLSHILSYHPDSYSTKILLSKAVDCVDELVDRLNTPKHETVDQWEKRTGGELS